MKKQLFIPIGAGLSAVAAIIGVLVTRETITASERAARDACAHIAKFTRIVEQDGPASSATRELEAAARLSRRAASLESRWIVLESGVQTLQVALSHDDAGAADEGLAVVQGQCRGAS